MPDPLGRAHVVAPPERLEEPIPVELLRSLAVLAEPPGVEHATLSTVLGLPAIPTAAEYSDVFLFQLYPYASVHLGPEGMMGGEARERISGFWSALGYVPPAEPDHLAALLGLYLTLAERETSLDEAERALGRQARRALLEEHLAPWVFTFLDRTQELTSGPYASWAELLAETLRTEWVGSEDRDPPTLPLHLREAPSLPDPRVEGGSAFLAGLLAPVRAGVTLTRADLGRVARDLDLGLRAGERRYALENLLAQGASGVLRALAAEARRQAMTHQARVSWLGPSADFFSERASSTADLLDELSETDALPASVHAGEGREAAP